ncbi:hypothetical protein PHLCEN_2v9544 [Hermanssonia centrifuga]|uniref:Enoyl reductase (ER) domain-containing protein n=1 Tax=Hermanssonia centrifuga TaxID=98765 RepID=A0A2R6NQI7_9APHY|nr:hypothetical protein PHLCEN_2v9544 [Hermanssonia centrifuga]
MGISKSTAPKPAADGNMIAYRYRPKAQAPVREEIPIPTPGPDEILIRVLAGGVCHSDVGILDPNCLGDAITRTCTMGHEGSGLVVALGSSVPSTHPELIMGSYVAVYCVDSCFKASCYACRTGRDNVCPNGTWIGLGSDGAWASHCVLRAVLAVPVPGNILTIPPAVVAISTDAVLTPYHALKTCVNLQPEQTILILGAGGLGLNAISIAKHCLNARYVLASDKRESSLAQALEMGADHAVLVDGLAGFLQESQTIVDIVVDFVGTQETFDIAVSVIAPGGRIQVVGLHAKTLQFATSVLMGKDVAIGSNFCGTKAELVEVLAAIAEGRIKPKVETRPLDDCVQVLDELRNGRLKNRVALIP